jgi:hypothetical protein
MRAHKKYNKKAFEMSFNWIFALIVGGMILFIAIYTAINWGDSMKNKGDTEACSQLVSLFSPMEAGIASGASDVIKFQSPSKIFIKCDNKNDKPFGNEKISCSGQVFGKYGEAGTPTTVKDKYVFGKNVTEGKDITYISFPFDMPFKIGDLIIFLNEKYCFFNAPDKVKEDLETHEALNNIINFSKNINDCKNKGKIVCFSSSSSFPNNCNIKVGAFCSDPNCEYEYEVGQVSKDGKTVSYSGNLVYAAIFSDLNIYECNVIRLKARADELYSVYLDKISVMNQRVGCGGSTFGLEGLKGIINSSDDLSYYYLESKDVDKANKAAVCNVY